ncbi:hypothetical protein RFI_38813 [Reticulomyxa filosa]|uniref:Uncharacterized protein n=1 Tax=Reticulomyxa filosa TaxID=46433 RepID=X6LD41_RETFI|nr:hypothetical protein RFI_38813 [Reticulomyxa filosa]|eukprot:ETN98679.1 hypothetical protein RFI_38813 [Reticulomyxa filosa]
MLQNNFLQVGGRDDKQIGMGNHLQNETFNAKDNVQSAMSSNHLQEKRYAKNDDNYLQNNTMRENSNNDNYLQNNTRRDCSTKNNYLQVKNDNYLQSHKTKNVSKKGIY